MVETQNLNINWLKQNEDGSYTNEIVLSESKEQSTRNLSSESELHRILKHIYKKEHGHIEVNEAGREIIPYLITLEIGKNVKRYDVLKEHGGILKVTRGEVTTEYVSEFCGASHSRTQKNLFVDRSIKDKLDDILLCGIPKNTDYPKPSKWNAYYALVTTNSKSVSTPNIVVIDDFEKAVMETVDVVKVTGSGEQKEYQVLSPTEKEIPILPFDGAGLVTPECASRWAEELNCRSKRTGRRYIPSCFQFRCLPALKGEAFTFDLRAFAREKGVSKIIDLGGREWDIFTDQIDMIVTKSQFKFWNLYLDNVGLFDCQKWKSAFEEEVHGYKRTFNIAKYADAPEDLKNTSLLSYQPLQTLNFTADEAEQLVLDSVKAYQKITFSVDEFLKYCGVSEDAEYIKPYYQALQYNHNLANDEYVRAKMQNDIKCMKNELLSGKQRVHGHYEVFCPDIYGLAEYAFSLEVKGLLPNPWTTYSKYWSEHDVSKVDVIRNPHIAMEHRVCQVATSAEMQKWYKYQECTIVSSIYDTLALTLSGADYDGDTVCTTDCPQIINAVKREIESGNGNLIVKDGESGKELKSVIISDVPGLMEVNARGYKNNIGSVIDRVTDLWTLSELYPECRKYIKIGTIVGAETIDFAKTGENASFPVEVLKFLKDKKKGYWMRYLEKNLAAAQDEALSMSNAEFFGGDPDKKKRFVDYDCNMNRLCHLAEQKIAEIDKQTEVVSEEDFDYRTLLSGNVHANRDVYRKVQILQDKYKKLADGIRASYKSKDKNEKANISLRYRMFYEKCRAELLYIVPDIDKLLDMLILIYYTKRDFRDNQKSKDLLWNAFPEEMIARAKSENINKQVDFKKLSVKHHKNNLAESKKKRTGKITIASIDRSDCADNEVIFYKEDREEIRKLILKHKIVKRSDNQVKYERLIAVLLYLSRKMNIQTLTLRNNCPGELSYQNIAILAGVNNDFIKPALKNLKECCAISIETMQSGDLKIDVLYYGKPFGEIWFSTEDYNQAGVKIRDYFRLDKAA